MTAFVIVDPDAASIASYFLQDDAEVAANQWSLARGDRASTPLLPHFSLTLGALFR